MTYPNERHGKPFASPRQLSARVDTARELAEQRLTELLRERLHLPMRTPARVEYMVTEDARHPTCGRVILTVVPDPSGGGHLAADIHWERTHTVTLRPTPANGYIELVDAPLHDSLSELRQAVLAKWHVYRYFEWADLAVEASVRGDPDALDEADRMAGEHRRAAIECGALAREDDHD